MSAPTLAAALAGHVKPPPGPKPSRVHLIRDYELTRSRKPSTLKPLEGIPTFADWLALQGPAG